MNRSAVTSLTLFACLALICAPAFAHHGTPASYQMDKTVTMTGTVTEFAFAYPHPQIYFDVKDENGNIQHCAAEIAPTPIMLKKGSGWTKETIKPGDAITITMHPSKSSPKTVGYTIELSINGKKLSMASAAQPPKE